jgi:hypothetical protein
MYNKFLQVIHQSIDLYAPISNTKQKPSIPKEIRLILKEKRKLYILSKSDNTYKAAYNEQVKKYKHAIKRYKQHCEQKIVTRKNSKVLYNYMKSKLQTRHNIPPLIQQNQEVCLDPITKANLLNNTFSKVFLKDDRHTPTPSLTTNTHIIPQSMNSVSKQDILNAIQRMKKSVSRTPDSLPSFYIHKTASQLVKPLYIIFNHSINTGSIPELWKKAIVIPIYKKGKRNLATNYRPISLTSVICRLLERIIHTRIHQHLLENHIISPAQHGFVQRRSTQTQQITFLNKLTTFHDNKTQVEIIYLDFSKAFDKVSHSKLLHVLSHLKLHHCLITWITNYLTGRTQLTMVDSSYSDISPVPSGVPQGSVLGPLLFIIYLQDLINKINMYCKNTTVYAFADDIKLLSTDPSDLQRALHIVDSWTANWQLLLNADKSEHFTIRNKAPKVFYIGHQIIPKVNKVKDLGVTIADDMEWNSHIHTIRSKSNSLSHIILRTFSPSNHQLLVNLFKIYVRPILEYNTCTWSPYFQTDIQAVESVQQTFTRKICQRANISYKDYNDRLSILGLESLQTRRTKNDLVMLYKIIYNIVDMDYTDYFEINKFGGYNLRRHSMHLTRKITPKTLCRQNFFSLRVIKYWNDLPESTVTSLSLPIFKSNIKPLTFH